MLAIIVGLLPLLLRLGMMFLDARGASAEEKKKFLGDFQAMQAQVDQSVKSHLQALAAKDQMGQWEKDQDAKKGPTV